ncbi:hypothetical protein SAMN05444008_101348 [Cnuella takakiae]|uniref:Uncharacterized protein n=1 Tax=Cnuella takakiae TaxID=1302690 RepID=A0A1M4T7F1_9BACT|nr:hypothetical protein SAMN05444008_101348 [Cnuella takakiae]
MLVCVLGCQLLESFLIKRIYLWHSPFCFTPLLVLRFIRPMLLSFVKQQLSLFPR